MGTHAEPRENERRKQGSQEGGSASEGKNPGRPEDASGILSLSSDTPVRAKRRFLADGVGFSRGTLRAAA
ncbi:hypothetical protein J31TS4_46360 [Paenibacillus sp. J31TS4]|nr:hypothetical protein J31TS4_46360 [Paenibacillus sp. J31TS4]